MTANTSRQNAAESAEGAQLFDRTTRDLPPGRHQFHKERMMAQIHETQADERAATKPAAPAKTRRFRLPRPAIALPALAAALAGVVVVGVAASGGGTGVEDGGLASGPALTTTVGTATTKGVPQLLDQIALTAAEGEHPAVKPGQYIYIESKTSSIFLKTVDDRTTLASHALHTRQVWESPDGTKGWLIDPAVNDSPEGETLSLPDEQGNTPQAYLNAPSYDYLAKLTTDPDALLAKIYKETEGAGNSPDQQAFTTIGDLLGESYPPAELSSALFKAAAKIPGVVVVDDAVDAAGRHGVAVARLDETSGQREEWIFDRKTHVYLGDRTVQVNRTTEEGGLIKPGTVVFTSAIMNRAIVDGIKQTPSQDG
ncbi:CU044_5270 family protein [Streptomyces sp. NBC_00487]|uniref:CU044_5270 family protein n=1 Tax=unclassified Streptomyces TaxID=2593676 RepID=UPI002DDADC09|nr:MULTISPECIES: CU044_5270 family protein [unclassified Streptomyces]WRY96950.1 CU044_5270 family protein [Streptomyces sp. NBC_00481]